MPSTILDHLKDFRSRKALQKKLSFFCTSRITEATESIHRWRIPVIRNHRIMDERKRNRLHTSLSLEIQRRLATHAWDWPIHAISSRGTFPDIFDEKVRDKLDYETVVPRESVIGPRKMAYVSSRDVRCGVWALVGNRLSWMCAREIWREREIKERKKKRGGGRVLSMSELMPG